MESFSADWLSLREPADHAARAVPLVDRIARAHHGRQQVRAMDLAGGTGSNIRFLLPRLPAVTHWTLVDHDDALLAHATESLAPIAHAAGVSFDTRSADLRDLSTLPLDGVGLVTGAALLDLVSTDWLRQLAARCRDARADMLFALSYNGGLDGTPADRDDERVRALVNQHQRTDKGFGVALGPDAAQVAADVFRAAGFEVQTAASDWVLDADRTELQRQLIEGWAGAARAMSPSDAPVIDAWLTRRLAHLAAGVSRVRVGHTDLVATTR